jgi:hypothetical protein
VILPIWHGINADGVRRASPLLADRVAITDTSDVASMGARIEREVRRVQAATMVWSPEDIVGGLEHAAGSTFARTRQAAFEDITHLLQGGEESLSARAREALERISRDVRHPLAPRAGTVLAEHEVMLRVARQAAETRQKYGPLGRLDQGICPNCGHSLGARYRGRGDMTVQRCESCDYVDAYY